MYQLQRLYATKYCYLIAALRREILEYRADRNRDILRIPTIPDNSSSCVSPHASMGRKPSETQDRYLVAVGQNIIWGA